MSGFSRNQLRSLTRKLDRRHVQTREIDGRSIDYLEGWFAIAEANAIFGFAGWDREMTHFEQTFERSRGEIAACGYLARVRIRVRAGDRYIVREGTGFGSATARNVGDAHERALKAAETDATKRALATFGNRFGLCLYDKEQHGVTGKKPVLIRFMISDNKGDPVICDLSPEAFCSGLRQMLEKADGSEEKEKLLHGNRKEIARLRSEAPDLKTARGIHYADILEQLANTNAEPPPPAPSTGCGVIIKAPLRPLRPSKIAPGPRIDKSSLPIGIERRMRDEDHLKFVRAQPCLICGRQPSHAHHLTFAQKRGLSLKVSDEFTVPLCSVHHDALHRSGPERQWWQEQGIDPLLVAEKMWKETGTASLNPIEASISNA